MPRTDRSVAILSGCIVAALYVILLVGFSRESYMRRDADAVRAVANAATGAISRQACREPTTDGSVP